MIFEIIIQMQSIPPQILPRQFRPKGYLSRFQVWPIYPNSSNLYWNNDEIIRFLITVNQGVMDPYRSHLTFTVITDEQSLPVGGLQIDSSAQSFISQTVISSNNVQVQRITEYDSLAAYLTDIGFSQIVCQGRDAEGLGYSFGMTNQPMTLTTQKYGGTLQSWYGNAYPTYTNLSTNTIMPTTASLITGRGNSAFVNNSGPYLANSQLAGVSSVAPSSSNILWAGNNNITGIGDVKTKYGRFSNVRSQYMTSILDRQFPDSNKSMLQTSPMIKGQTWDVGNMMQVNTQSGFNPKAPYKIGYPETITVVQERDPTLDVPISLHIPNTCNLFGYQKAIIPQLSRGCNQMFISPTIPQLQLTYGNILPQAIPVSQKTFRVPLISAVCGLLIPPDQFLLIPMQALYNLLIQITLNRFAMFTTGFNDVHEFDSYGMSFMQKRSWKIKDIAYNIHLYTFGSQQINQLIQSSLVKEIPISNSSYILASQFQLPNGQVVRNGWPINVQVESLAEIISFFIPNDYQTKTFCRKHFRLSNNITSMQLKFNTQYYPTQPLTGNAGCPQATDQTGDNWSFYEQILLSNNFLFNINNPYPKINPKNFAINERCYDINNVKTFYDKAMYNNIHYEWTKQSVNADTAMGMANFHQNRYRGTAAFIWSFQPYGHSKQYMTGLNTLGSTNFVIQFNNSPLNPFPRDQTLFIFVRVNTMTIFNEKGVKVVGR